MEIKSKKSENYEADKPAQQNGKGVTKTVLAVTGVVVLALLAVLLIVSKKKRKNK